jgi:ABC-2 type transport system ATP-binding protein
VFLNAAILGMARRDIERRFDEIVDFSGLEQFIDQSVKTYSSGMYVRLAFAVAINVEPDMLLIDEILAVGDVTFQQKCMEKFVDFREEGRTLVLVTHDLSNVRNFCDRAIWLANGVVLAEGEPADLIDRYTESMLGGHSDDGGDTTARRGPGPLRIDSAELLVGGKVVDQVRTGDDVIVRLHVTAPETVRTPVFALTVASLAGAVITAPSSRETHDVPSTLLGKATIDVRLGALPLLPGSYVIHTEATNFDRQHLFDHVQNAVRFDVLTGDTREVNGLVTLRPTWTIDEDPSPNHGLPTMPT